MIAPVGKCNLEDLAYFCKYIEITAVTTDLSIAVGIKQHVFILIQEYFKQPLH